MDVSKNLPPQKEDPPLRSDSSGEIFSESEESIPPLPPPLPSLDELCRKRKVLLLSNTIQIKIYILPSVSVLTKAYLLYIPLTLKKVPKPSLNEVST